MPKNQRTVDEILSGLEPQQMEITQKLRALVKSTVPDVAETVRRGNITYLLSGKDFVWILQYKGHTDLEFFMGASLSSPLLKKRGEKEKREAVRHIEVKTVDKMEPELIRLLKEAAATGTEHCGPTTRRV